MKTRQLMIRKLEGYVIGQETSYGFFNATNFLKQWSKESPNYTKKLEDFWGIKGLDVFLIELIKDGKKLTTDFDKELFDELIKEHEFLTESDSLTLWAKMNDDSRNRGSTKNHAHAHDFNSKNELDISKLNF